MPSTLDLSGEVRDFPCPDCAALMKLKWSRLYTRWFYGCAKYPACHHTFDAEQGTGAPLPGVDGLPVPKNHFEASDWTSGHPEMTTGIPRWPGKALWNAVLDDSFLTGPFTVMPEAFTDSDESPAPSPKKRPQKQSVDGRTEDDLFFYHSSRRRR